MKKTIIIIASIVIAVALATVFDQSLSRWLRTFDSAFFEGVRTIAYFPTYLFLSTVIGYLIGVHYQRWPKQTLGAFIVVYGVLSVLLYEKTHDYFTHGVMSVIIFIVLSVPAFLGGFKCKDSLHYHVHALSTLMAYFGLIVGVQGLKILAGRPRPGIGDDFVAWFDLSGASTESVMQSLPSGHTTFAALLLGASLIVFLKKRFTIMLIATIWVLLVMISSVAVGAHYVTDTLFGALLGTVSVPVVFMMMHYVQKRVIE